MNAPTPVDLGDAIERIVARIVREGRYASRDEVLRAGVLALEEELEADDACTAHAPDGPDLGDDMEAVGEGLADIAAGRVKPAEEVFERLRVRFATR
jgi:antitoxin ParD1/3/4